MSRTKKTGRKGKKKSKAPLNVEKDAKKQKLDESLMENKIAKIDEKKSKKKKSKKQKSEPKPPTPPPADSSDSSDSDNDAEQEKPQTTTPQVKETKKDSSDSDSSDSDSDEEEKTAEPTKKSAVESKEDSDSSSSDDEEDGDKKMTEAKKTPQAKEEESSSEEDSDEDEEKETEQTKKGEESSSDSSDNESSSDEEDGVDVHMKDDDKKNVAMGKKRKAQSNDGEDKPKKKTKGAPADIFVGGVSYDATEDDLMEFFKECGEIVTCKIPLNDRGQSKGIAFMTFATEEAGEKAIAKNGEDLLGRWLNISKARSKPESQRGGGRERGTGASQYKKAKSERPEGCKTLFCGGLSWTLEEDAMREFFQDCGEITSVRIITDRETGRAKGYGYVEFASEDSIDKAMETKDMQSLAGRIVRLDYAASRQNFGGGGFGGRSSGGGYGGRSGGGRFGGGRGRGGRGRGRGGRGRGGRVNKEKGSIQEFKGNRITF